MKKHTLKISTVSVLCVLCAVATDAFGAGSVRALGGTGTYNGTAAATSATTSSTAARANRAGSLRISPSTTRSVSTATRTTPSGATESTQRLSIGKYLGGATSVSTSGGSSSGGSATPGATAAEIAEINNNITNIISNADRIEDKVDAIDNAKQDKLIADDEGIVEIENSTVSINMDNLAAALQSQGWAMGHKIELRYDGDAHLEWRYADTPSATWTKLMNLDELAGTYATATDLANAISGLASTYATKSEVDALSDIVAQKADSDSVYTKTATDALLEAKANTADVYTKGEVDTAVASGIAGAGLSAYAKTADLAPVATSGSYNSLTDKPTIPVVPTNVSAFTNDVPYATTAELAQKANSADVYTAAQTDALLNAKQDTISDIETIRSNATAGKTASDALGTGFDSTNTVASAITALETKTNALPTSVALDTANGKITALETAVGDANSGLTKSVADNAAAIATNADNIETLQATVDGIEIPVVPTKVSAFENDAGYLTEHQSLADYATTAAMNTALAGKQNSLSEEQLAAVNSGVTQTVVAQVEANRTVNETQHEAIVANAEAIAGKQDKLNDAQTLAINSGITADKVSAYDAYATAINSKADAAAVATELNKKADAEAVQDALDLKANTADVNTALALKANADDVYPKSETYSKSQVDSKVADVVAGDMTSALSEYAKTSDVAATYATQTALEAKADKSGVYPKAVAIPGSGQYVLGFVDGVQTYIPVVDANGNAGDPIVAQVNE